VPIVIYGAGIVGQALVKAGVKAIAFIDDNPKKKVCMRLPVLSLTRFKKLYKEAFIIISVADIGDVVKSLDNYEWATCAHYLADYKPSTDFERYAINTAVNCQSAFESGKLFLHSVDLIITERCSLKCKDCSNLMQYYEHPQDDDTTEVLASIDRLFELVDEVNEVRVIGGEPFMNKDWHIITRRLIKEPKLHYVVIYTNGTINPPQLLGVLSDKVLMLITDYGKLSVNKDKFIKVCKDFYIPHYVQKVGGWTACSNIQYHKRSPAQNIALFKSCCVHNLVNLSKGKLYRCPFAANFARLKPLLDMDHVDLSVASREGIERWLKREFIHACEYCNGRPFGAPEIPPAIQRE